jgi:hypothetical protein
MHLFLLLKDVYIFKKYLFLYLLWYIFYLLIDTYVICNTISIMHNDHNLLSTYDMIWLI